MTNSHYNKELKPLAKILRKDSTLGEILMWDKILKQKKLGYQFLRQFSIDNYIVDFACRSLKLIIGIDGYSHNFKVEKDKIRDNHLGSLGYTVLRFSENEIRNDLMNVQRAIEAYIKGFEEFNPPTPFARGECSE